MIRALPLLLLGACRPLLADYEPPVETDTGVDTDRDTDAAVVLDDWPHAPDAPWGMRLEILAVDGGSGPDGALQVGDTPTVTFVAVDDDDVPYVPEDYTSLQFGISGPTTHVDIVYYGPENVGDATTLTPVAWDPLEAPEGVAWRYTFPTPIPVTYHAPPNDTTDIGEDLGDWGGLPLVSGTYLVGAWAYVRHDTTDGVVYDAASKVTNVRLGDATTLEPRERVLTSNCNRCHGQLEMHDRKIAGDVSVCLMCHVMGSEDAYSSEDPTTTPGLSLFLPVMIHKIHHGKSLSTPLVINGAPLDDTDPSWPDYNSHDYSNVVYPILPARTGECFTCHGDAAQGDVQERSTRNACGACHDDIVWATGEGHGDGGAAYDDNGCANSGCHPPSTIVLEHRDVRLDPAKNPGLRIAILKVTGGTGTGSQFVPGDTLTVEFTATHDDGSRVDLPTEMFGGAMRIGGPVQHSQTVLDLRDVSTKSVEDIVNHTWRYTATTAWPAVYPPPANDTPALGLVDGEWSGLPLVDGTYRVLVSGYLQLTLDDGTTIVRVPAADTTDVLVGGATTLEEHAPVSQSQCEACHNKLWAHSSTRTDVKACPICHVAGAEDRESATKPEITPGVTIEFPILMHRLHSGSNLSAPVQFNAFAGLNDYSQVVFPRLDGGTTRCDACHVPGAYDNLSGRVCMSCHDSVGTRSHVALNTHETYGESCAVCHGPNRAQSVEAAHGLTR